jgi:hypothetical protein
MSNGRGAIGSGIPWGIVIIVGLLLVAAATVDFRNGGISAFLSYPQASQR